MYVQVRTIDGKQNVTVTVSKLTTVVQFKELVEKELNVKCEKQRLFFRGKQLEDDYKIFDYNINVNDVVQLMIKPDLPELNKDAEKETDCSDSKPEKNEVNNSKKLKEEEFPTESKYFKIGDYVDAKDLCYGAWFEGKIVGIFKDINKLETDPTEEDDCLIYKVFFQSYPDDPPLLISLKDIRPRARTILSIDSIKVGDLVMVNYNIEEAQERGYWYDLKVTNISKNGRRKPVLKGTLYVGTENTNLDDSTIAFTDEVMKIEPKKLITERTEDELELMQQDTEKKRVNAPYCPNCSDNPRRKCRECGCHNCGGKNDPEKQVMCDECNMAFHISCLKPPLSKIPEVDEWYCSDCKNDDTEIVKAGEKLKESKKKAKMASAINNSSRDWGKGMACVGRTKECTLVPPNHFGPIPGVEVGTTWKFRVQASEAGVHRPHVAGIHGRESDGAFSLVLSGGYEDDIDSGEEFFYTGSGGRDLSGNKRTAEQSSDQQLTRMNKALALNCNAKFDANKGAEAKDWRGGKPVRVVRNFKLGKHSKYAPEDGNRYDGIYKVVKYYPEKGKSGYIVWRYLLRRDDPAPAPWTKEGKARVESLGLEMVFPDGYLAAMEKKEKENIPANSKLKRFFTDSSEGSPQKKKAKLVAYKLEADVEDKINNDTANSKLWDMTKVALDMGKKEFLSKVEETFMCICCQELVYQPITTQCGHNMCLVCLQRSFSAEVYTCPYCRTELGKQFEMKQNKSLQAALLLLFPGYSAGR
ncbi:E3 ubiquitin-protein ligase UHRF1 [Halyomorpha halys]|uniref:E3 ubiquitin-protein ligase UHRF1 n=1 Tax=Halyomorpha halys TaxID=286706 RepID=UPI0006D4FFEA|nr:E3 ubiquitin-protein ligase UHRF1-like [Halyomorpha halys]